MSVLSTAGAVATGAAPGASADAPIEVSGLRKSYGSRAAVDGVELTVRRGEVFALLGPNGAGKTTTVEILEGFRRRDSGTVRVLGEDPSTDRRAWRARIGIVPQSTGAYSDLTVREVVAHFAAMYADPLRVDEVIEMVGLTAERRKQATSMSGGQQRRLDVAVGIIGNPELIFLDEPTTGLDPAARRDAWDLVRFFADRGATTVLTTHYLDEAEALAARAAIIVNGRVVQCGPLAELGGRASGTSTVSFAPPPALLAQSHSVLGPDAVVDGGLITLQTGTPTAVLARLLEFAAAMGLAELPQLRVHQPSLEEVYLDLLHRTEEASSHGQH
jgi:ABC-2 type transport system ATP-binding protein